MNLGQALILYSDIPEDNREEADKKLGLTFDKSSIWQSHSSALKGCNKSLRIL